MQGVGLELFTGHVGDNGRGQTHQASSLVLRGITPSVALLASARAVSIGARLRAATALQFAVAIAVARLALGVTVGGVALDGSSAVVAILIASEASLSKRDVVGTRDSLVSPRHDERCRRERCLGLDVLVVKERWWIDLVNPKAVGDGRQFLEGGCAPALGSKGMARSSGLNAGVSLLTWLTCILYLLAGTLGVSILLFYILMNIFLTFGGLDN